MHTLIIGMTESGKTTIAKILCKGLKKRKKKTAVLDPLLDNEWKADFVTHNKSEFLAYAKSNQSNYLFIDEGSESIGRYDVSMQWFATQSRHWGHSCFFISQGLTQMSAIVRSQCSRVICFAVSQSNIDIISEEWNIPELRNMSRLNKGEFYVIDRFNPLMKGSIDFEKQTVYYIQIESRKAVKGNAKPKPSPPVDSVDMPDSIDGMQ